MSVNFLLAVFFFFVCVFTPTVFSKRQSDSDPYCEGSGISPTLTQYISYLNAFNVTTDVSYLVSDDYGNPLIRYGLLWPDVAVQAIAASFATDTVSPYYTWLTSDNQTRSGIAYRAVGREYPYPNGNKIIPTTTTTMGLLKAATSQNSSQFNATTPGSVLNDVTLHGTIWEVYMLILLEPNVSNASALGYKHLDGFLDTLDLLRMLCNSSLAEGYLETVPSSCWNGMLLSLSHVQLVSFSRSVSALLIERFASDLKSQEKRLQRLQTLGNVATRYLTRVLFSSESGLLNFGVRYVNGKQFIIPLSGVGPSASLPQLYALLTLSTEYEEVFGIKSTSVMYSVLKLWGVCSARNASNTSECVEYNGVGNTSVVDGAVTWMTVIAASDLAESYKQQQDPEASAAMKLIADQLSKSPTLSYMACKPKVVGTVLDGNTEDLMAVRYSSDPYEPDAWEGTIPPSASISATAWHVFYHKRLNPLRILRTVPIPSQTPSPTPSPTTTPTPSPTTTTTNPPTPSPTQTPTMAPPNTTNPPTVTPTVTPTSTPTSTPASNTTHPPHTTLHPPNPPPTTTPSPSGQSPSPPSPDDNTQLGVWLGVVGSILFVIGGVLVWRTVRVRQGYAQL
eukprot:PhF_6_TR993/c0_g1_i1/m.1945